MRPVDGARVQSVDLLDLGHLTDKQRVTVGQVQVRRAQLFTDHHLHQLASLPRIAVTSTAYSYHLSRLTQVLSSS